MRTVIHPTRVYDLDDEARGARWLVDRIWPRGIGKEALRLDGWAREAAPSAELRRSFGHDPERWEEFRCRYGAELDAHPDAWRPLLEAARTQDLLLLYAARDTEHNNAVVLRDYLDRRLAAPAEGGESVCWLHLVCPECGYLADGPAGPSCGRCGAPLHHDAGA